MARSRLVCEPNNGGPCVKAVRSQRGAFPRTWPSATVPIRGAGARWQAEHSDRTGAGAALSPPAEIGHDALVPDSTLRRYWFEFDDFDGCGCKLPHKCGVTALDRADALRMVANEYCAQLVRPTPQRTIEDVDVSTLDDDLNVRPNIGVPVWRGIWYPFVTRT